MDRTKRKLVALLAGAVPVVAAVLVALSASGHG
jgi:hypothetical protein